MSKTSKRAVASVCAYIAIVFFAIALVISHFIPSLSETINLISKIAGIIALAISGYEFTIGSKSLIKIIFWVSLVVIILFFFVI